MTTDNRILCPSFRIALGTLVGVATASPDRTNRHAYLDSDGGPFNLVGHVLDDLGAPIRTAAEGHLDHHIIAMAKAGVPGAPRVTASLPLLWNRLFTLDDINGEPVPYDGYFTMFWGMKDDRKPAEEYLVYALLNHVVSPSGREKHALLDWRGEAIRGIKSFRGFLLSPSSGFLVQTHGSHKDVLDYVDQLTLSALSDLERK